MTAAQAVECLGRAVHVGVARRLVLRLAAEGVLSTGLTYGSAFSGIETFAAGVDQVFGEDWRYAFASEASAVARRGLCAAWGSRALTEGMVWQDARGEHCKPSTGPSSRSSCLKSPKYGTFEARATEPILLSFPPEKGKPPWTTS